jgi:hypothetical protein
MRFFLTILIVCGVVSGAFVLRDKREAMQMQAWSVQLMPFVKPLTDGTPNAASPALPDEASFFKLLCMLYTLEQQHRLDLRHILQETCSRLGMLGEKADLVQETLLENYETAKRFHMFDEPSNIMKLERGEPVPLHIPGWEGELSAVGQIVPGALAPEVANCLPNLVLLPAAARDAQDGSISTQTQDHARNLARCGFLDRMSLDVVMRSKKQVK